MIVLYILSPRRSKSANQDGKHFVGGVLRLPIVVLDESDIELGGTEIVRGARKMAAMMSSNVEQNLRRPTRRDGSDWTA